MRRALLAGFGAIPFAGLLALCIAVPANSQQRQGAIPHPPLLKMVLPDTANQEVAVYETEYAPGGITRVTCIRRPSRFMSCPERASGRKKASRP